MGAARRKFTLECKTEAPHRVIDMGRAIAEVAAELSVVDSSLARLVRDKRRRMETVAGSSDEPLTAAERTELLRLWRQVAEMDKDLAFGKSCRVLRFKSTKAERFALMAAECANFGDHPHGPLVGGVFGQCQTENGTKSFQKVFGEISPQVVGAD